jgi:hypothetical protein
MSSTLAVDRSRLCTFTFANGCQCRIPLTHAHPYLCTFHARKEAQARAAEVAGKTIAFDLSARYISFCDLSSALAHTMTALAQRQLTPRTATSFAYLGQILFQSLDRAESEYIRTFGVDSWKNEVSANFNSSHSAPSCSSNDDASNDDASNDDAASDDASDDPANHEQDDIEQDEEQLGNAHPEEAESEDAELEDAELEDAESQDDLAKVPTSTLSQRRTPHLQPPPATAAFLNRFRKSMETP